MKVPMSWRRPATSRRRRSRLPEAVLADESVVDREREVGDVARVGLVVMEFAPERGRARDDLGCASPASIPGVGAQGRGKEEALADGHVGHDDGFGAGPLEEEPLDGEGGAYPLRVGPGHAKPRDAVLGRQPRDLVGEGDEGGAADDGIVLASFRDAPDGSEPRGGEPRVAADHDEGLYRLEGQLGVEVVAGSAYVVLEELAEIGVRYTGSADLLVDAHRADPAGNGRRPCARA